MRIGQSVGEKERRYAPVACFPAVNIGIGEVSHIEFGSGTSNHSPFKIGVEHFSSGTPTCANGDSVP
jgi:hypothetical protein